MGTKQKLDDIGGEFKTRSPLYLRQMSDDVRAKLAEKATALGVANWVIVEKLLESGLGIETNGIDLYKWLGINKNRARLGKPYSKKIVK